jgi:hypothetical protein
MASTLWALAQPLSSARASWATVRAKSSRPISSSLLAASVRISVGIEVIQAVQPGERDQGWPYPLNGIFAELIGVNNPRGLTPAKRARLTALAQGGVC